eukprot:5851766-Ditylum_brightwellii.AAC.1
MESIHFQHMPPKEVATWLLGAKRICLLAVHPGPSFHSGDEMILTSFLLSLAISSKTIGYGPEELHQGGKGELGIWCAVWKIYRKSSDTKQDMMQNET